MNKTELNSDCKQDFRKKKNKKKILSVFFGMPKKKTKNKNSIGLFWNAEKKQLKMKFLSVFLNFRNKAIKKQKIYRLFLISEKKQSKLKNLSFFEFPEKKNKK